VIHAIPDGDVKVNDSIVVFKPLRWVNEPIVIVGDVLLKHVDLVGQILDFVFVGFLAVEHGFGQAMCQLEENLLADVGVCLDDVEGTVQGVGVLEQ
jgi:hypothetical protein